MRAESTEAKHSPANLDRIVERDVQKDAARDAEQRLAVAKWISELGVVAVEEQIGRRRIGLRPPRACSRQ